MMKKTYSNPTLLVTAIQEDDTILAGSITEVVSDDTGIGYGGGTTEPGRSRRDNAWDFEDEEEDF